VRQLASEIVVGRIMWAKYQSSIGIVFGK